MPHYSAVRKQHVTIEPVITHTSVLYCNVEEVHGKETVKSKRKQETVAILSLMLLCLCSFCKAKSTHAQ